MFIFILLILGGMCSIIGYARGVRGFVDMTALFVIGVMVFPVGLVVSIVWPIDDDPTKFDCPQCAETIKVKANVCWCCGLDLVAWRRGSRR